MSEAARMLDINEDDSTITVGQHESNVGFFLHHNILLIPSSFFTLSSKNFI